MSKKFKIENKNTNSKIVRKTNNKANQPLSLSEVSLESQANFAVKPTLIEFTLLVLYKNLYVLGITLLRRKLKIKRKIKRYIHICMGSSYAFIEKIGVLIFDAYKNVAKKIRAPIESITSIRNEVAPAIEIAKADDKIPISSYLHIGKYLARFILTIIATLFNYIAPIFAVILLVSTINAYINQPLGLAVEYNDEIIGYIESEDEFEIAAQTLKSRFISTSTESFVKIPRFTLVAINPKNNGKNESVFGNLMRLTIAPEDYSTVDELADKMVRASGSEIEKAYGFYINDRFYGAVKEREYIPTQLEQILDRNIIGMPDERVEFVKKIGVNEGLYPINSIKNTEDIKALINSNETENQIYTVQTGDTPTTIAEKVGIPYSLLKQINPDIEEKLQVGQEVLTQIEQPFLSVKNIYTSVDEEEYDFETLEIETSTFAKGYTEITQEGVPGVRQVTAKVTEINGIEVSRATLESRVIKLPKTKKIIVGTNNPATIQSGSSSLTTDMQGSSATSSTGFAWPTQGGRITVPVGGYPGHMGVDIPRPAGTPIYASAAGTVVIARNTYTGYGKYVVIDHGNGYTTLYAHSTQLFVSVGDRVSQGQVISSVGRTGWATGNHLHFEIKKNGKIVLPQNYVGSSG